MEINRLAGSFIQPVLVQLYGPLPKPKNVVGKEKYLIINGDDLGRDKETNEAIVSAFKRGILTSASAFINFEESAEQLKMVHRENPELPIGLHLNLTSGYSVAPSQEVIHIIGNNGKFHDIDQIIVHLPVMPIEEVKKELFAQAELFISTGVPMDHINYHHHLAALYTPFFKIVRELAQKYNVPLRNPVPASIYNMIVLNGNGGGSSEGMKKMVRFGITHPFKCFPIIKKISPRAIVEQENRMLSEGIISTNWFIDNFYKNASVANFISILEQLPAGTSEIMCHPGLNGELEVLTNPSVKKAIHTLGIHLVSWSMLT